MFEYTIISLLIIAWTVQTWRKRIWKRRAKANYLGFWGMAYKQMQDAKEDGSTGLARRKHWPDVIDEK